MSELGLLRGSLRALQGPGLLLVLVVTALDSLARAGGLIGLPLGIIASSWCFTYVYLVVEALARGKPVPLLAIEHANPAHEPRPLLLAALTLAAAGLIGWTADRWGTFAGAWATGAVLVAWPAAVALVAVEGHALRVLSPLALARVAHGLGARYVLLAAGVLLGAAAIASLAERLSFAAIVACTQVLAYGFAGALGAALHARRHELGLETWQSAERDAERLARADERERSEFTTGLYALVRTRRPDELWARAGGWLAAHGREPADFRWLRDRALAWGEPQLADRFTEELVVRLIALGRRGEAVDELAGCWKRGGQCLPAGGLDRDALLSTARALGRTALVERLRREMTAR
ncbi:MAG: hypothetical protein JSR73_01895 [Proteobacteria bacterium]|nr:hypothetical protein [Pseudomonadota bacterium]